MPWSQLPILKAHSHGYITHLSWLHISHIVALSYFGNRLHGKIEQRDLSTCFFEQQEGAQKDGGVKEKETGKNVQMILDQSAMNAKESEEGKKIA